jgi:signal transduction histidine kinase
VSSKIKLKLSEGSSALSRRRDKKGKVLIVDDEQANLDGLEAALSRSYQVFQTTDPNEAIALSRSHHIDLVITDQRMPEMLGTELLQELYNQQRDQIRILLTGYTDAEDLITCINDGLLYRYLVKPWSPPELMATVAQGFDKLNAERALKENAAQLKREVEERRRAQTQLEATLEELKEAQDQIVAQERLKALGEMVSGVAHDFNNVLTPILAYSEELLELEPSAPLEDADREALEGIRDAATDGAAMIERLRASYLPSVKGFKGAHTLEVNGLIQSALKLSLPRWSSKLPLPDLKLEIDPELKLTGQLSDLRQALVNVICNALDATESRMSRESDSQALTLTIKAFAQHEWIYIEVIDQADGMPPAVLAMCQKAFFSTKGSSGTGLGLHMVQETLKRHHGHLQIMSVEREGTTVRFKVPQQPSELGGVDEA